MELQLQELLDKIKLEGVAKADKEAETIIKNAKIKAAEIIKNAQNEADGIIKNAKNSASQFIDSGEKALIQSGRDLLITIRAKIISIFEELLKTDIKNTYSPDLLSEMLEKIARNWNHEKSQVLEILLNPIDLKSLEDHYFLKLQKKLRAGFLFKPVDTIDKGFLIGIHDKNTFYDFTDMGISEFLSRYLNPHLSAIIKKADDSSGKKENE